MFYIEPTPISWMIWVALYVIIIIATLVAAYIVYRIQIKKGKLKKQTITPIWIVLIIGVLVAVGLTGSSYYHNYIHSASYVSQKRDLQNEYATDRVQREIVVYNRDNKITYQYKGYFSFKRNNRSVNLTDTKTGEKVSIYIGNLSTVVVTDYTK
jgi:ABC-type multidrug transport system fused ATPase/permease subunit